MGVPVLGNSEAAGVISCSLGIASQGATQVI